MKNLIILVVTLCFSAIYAQNIDRPCLVAVNATPQEESGIKYLEASCYNGSAFGFRPEYGCVETVTLPTRNCWIDGARIEIKPAKVWVVWEFDSAVYKNYLSSAKSAEDFRRNDAHFDEKYLELEEVVAKATTTWTKGKCDKNCLAQCPEDNCRMMALLEMPIIYLPKIQKRRKDEPQDLPQDSYESYQELVLVKAAYYFYTYKDLTPKGICDEWQKDSIFIPKTYKIRENRRLKIGYMPKIKITPAEFGSIKVPASTYITFEKHVPCDKIQKDLDAGKMPLFSRYPNPANEVLYIEHAYNNPVQVQLCNIQGQLLGKWEVKEPFSQINLQPFAAGMYVVYLFSEGKRVGQEKLWIGN